MTERRNSLCKSTEAKFLDVFRELEVGVRS